MWRGQRRWNDDNGGGVIIDDSPTDIVPHDLAHNYLYTLVKKVRKVDIFGSSTTKNDIFKYILQQNLAEKWPYN